MAEMTRHIRRSILGRLSNGSAGIYGASALLLAVASLIRLMLISPPAATNGDSAVYALMAKHIVELKEFPIFMWGQHYAGSLMSYIGAFLFSLFGISATFFLLAGVLCSCVWVLLTASLARKELNDTGFIAALFLVALPPLQVLSYSIYTGGTECEALYFGILLLFLLNKWNREFQNQQRGFYAVLGLASGAGLWLTPALAPMVMAVIFVFYLRDRRIFLSRRILYFIGGTFAGLLPMAVYNFQNSGATILRLGGRSLNISRDMLLQQDVADLIVGHIFWRVSSIPGALAQMPSLLFELMGLFSSTLLLVAVAVAAWKFFSAEDKKIDFITLCLIYVLCFTSFYTCFVGEDDVRFMSPLYVVFPFLAGKLVSDIKSRPVVVSLMTVIIIVTSNGYSNVYALMKNNIKYIELAGHLLSKNLLYGYSDYGTAYAVVFETQEKVLMSPTLFHPTFQERRPEYTARVRNTPHPVYVVNQAVYPHVAAQIEDQFRRRGMSYQRDSVAQFLVYRDLSRAIAPEELGLSPGP